MNRKINFVLLLLAIALIGASGASALPTTVTEIDIYTDSSWKTLDAKVNGWTSINFDDSYWLDAKEERPVGEVEKARIISDIEKPSSAPFYFRKTFELGGTEIIGGKLFGFTGCPTVYVNDNKVNIGCGGNADITPYLKIGKNVIAVDSSGEIGFLAKINVVSASAPSPSPTITSTPSTPTLPTIVTKNQIYTNSSWKTLDAKVNNWTSINFDDSYWLGAKEERPVGEIEKAQIINYPEKPSSAPFYFRKTFELGGTEIIGGKLFGFTGCPTVYVNDNKVNIGCGGNADITPYLKIGKNVIAVDSSGEIGFLAKIRVVSAISISNISFAANLTGGEEVPPVVTLARSNAIFNLSDNGTVLKFNVTVANITNATLSHIHLAPPGVNGSIVVSLFTGLAKTGRFDGVLAEGNITQANLTGPLAGQPLSALINNMTANNTYVNVHTIQHPDGEIRGQIQVAPSSNVTSSNVTPLATP